MWSNFRGDQWKPHHCWCQGQDLLGGLSHISSDTRKSEQSKKWWNSRHEIYALRAWWGITLGSTTSRWIETSQPRNLFQSGLMVSALLSACFVVLFTQPAWFFVPPGSYVQKPPTSTLGGTDDPNGTSREPRGWLQQTSHTRNTELIQTFSNHDLFGADAWVWMCLCAGWQRIQPWWAEN